MSESGHEKNVANFAQVVNIVTALGADYEPGRNLIALSNLKFALTQAQAAIAEAGLEKAAARNEILYHPKTGILNLVKLIKIHLLYAAGRDSAAYQQINALSFKEEINYRKRGSDEGVRSANG